MSDLSEWTIKAVGTDGALVLEKGDVHLGLGPGPQSLSNLLRAANKQDLLVRGLELEAAWERDQIRLHGIRSADLYEQDTVEPDVQSAEPYGQAGRYDEPGAAAHNAGVRRHSQRWGMS